jgi:hypothetical protein
LSETPEKWQTFFTCACCGEKFERDLLVFLSHADKHIIDAIKKEHPEWVESDGACPKCIDYFRSELGREPY